MCILTPPVLTDVLKEPVIYISIRFFLRHFNKKNERGPEFREKKDFSKISYGDYLEIDLVFQKMQ